MSAAEKSAKKVESKKVKKAESKTVAPAPPADVAPAPPAPPVEPQEDVAGKLLELEDKYLRLMAEFENYRKRMQREQLLAFNKNTATLIGAWLPVLDDLVRAGESTRHPNSSVEDLRKGLELIEKKFKKQLDQHEVTEIKVSQGDDFDAELHEAVAQAPPPTSALRGKVLAVMEKGYKLRDKVIRYAKVQTASHE